jgi:hypothetical protein
MGLTARPRGHARPVPTVATIVLVATLLVSCGSDRRSSSSRSTSSTTTASTRTSGGEHAWKGPAVSSTAIPLGDGNVSTDPHVDDVDSCTTNFRRGGAAHTGDWIDSATNTWNATSKPAVEGSVTWPDASNSFSVREAARTVTTNALPKDTDTGTFPITQSDPAYQYDRNPNRVTAHPLSYSLPAMPTAAATPSCLGLGPIGVMTNGVVVFDALDDAGRDAGAHEIQDRCNGHPQGAGIYHYHDLSPCLVDRTASSSTLVGYALDGYGIYVERDAHGNLPTNADLDACHGRTSSVAWDGQQVDMYHYDVTLEYPYTLGCYHGTPVASGAGRV